MAAVAKRVAGEVAEAAGTASGTSGSVSPQKKFVQMRFDMLKCLIEREDETDLVLTGLIANQHPLFVGEPGTAKSMLGRAVAEWLNGRQYEILLSKHTDPSELFGPVSIPDLEKGEYKRLIDATLADAEVAFLDEIFKASPAILNTMLGVINERRYRNGKAVVRCPLVMAVAASNEWPQDSDTGGKELGALFDRFLIRKTVNPIRSPEGEERLLWDDKLAVELTTSITVGEITYARKEAEALVYTAEAKDVFVEILRALEAEGIRPGDRRKRWSVGLVKAFAYLSGATRVEKEHLEVLSHTLWVDPREQPVKTAQVVAKLANPAGVEINALLLESREIIKGASHASFAEVMGAAVKLEEIVKKLKAHKDVPKGRSARDYVAGQLQKMRQAAVSRGAVTTDD